MKTINKVLLGMGIVALILILLLGFYVFYVVPGLSPSMEPLRFSIHNWDESKHDVRVEIFDSNNKTSFNKSYSIEPRRYIQSSEITEIRGEYMFKVILDNNITKMHKAYVAEGNAGVHIMIKPYSHIDISNVVCD